MLHIDEEVIIAIALLIAGTMITLVGIGMISSYLLGASVALVFGVASLIAGIVVILRH